MLKILSKFLPLIIHEIADFVFEKIEKKRKEKELKKTENE